VDGGCGGLEEARSLEEGEKKEENELWTAYLPLWRGGKEEKKETDASHFRAGLDKGEKLRRSLSEREREERAVV